VCRPIHPPPLGHIASILSIPNYTYLVLKMPAPNGVLSVYGGLMVSFKCDSEAFDIAVMSACVNASAVLVVEAKRVALSDLTNPE
jgi:hypothetical protein